MSKKKTSKLVRLRSLVLDPEMELVIDWSQRTYAWTKGANQIITMVPIGDMESTLRVWEKKPHLNGFIRVLS